MTSVSELDVAAEKEEKMVVVPAVPKEASVLDMKVLEAGIREVHPAVRGQRQDANGDVPMIPELECVGAIVWPVDWDFGSGGGNSGVEAMSDEWAEEKKYDSRGNLSRESGPASPDIEVPPLQIPRRRDEGVRGAMRGEKETRKVKSSNTLRRFALERSWNGSPEMSFLRGERMV